MNKPFLSYIDTLKSMYGMDGFREMMDGKIQNLRIEISEHLHTSLDELRFKQGELKAYKELLQSCRYAFENNATKEGKK